MRRHLFNSICERLKDKVPEIKYYDLWNESMSAIQTGPIFDTPAVFFEFDPVTFSHQARGIPRGTVTLTLHVITKYIPLRPLRSSDAPTGLAHLDLLERIESALTGFSGQGFSPLLLSSSEIDHNHAELQDHKERFKTSVSYPSNFGAGGSGVRLSSPISLTITEAES